MPYLGKSPSFGVRQRYQYTATASQTTFSGTDTANLTLNYTDNNFIDVFQNGVLLKGGGNDYTATSGTSVVLGTGATADDVIEIIVYDAFSAANFYNRTDSDSRYVNVSGDTMTGALDLDGQELVLDADGDTSITADTDDTIDIKTGGTDRIRIDDSGTFMKGITSAQTNAGIVPRFQIEGSSSNETALSIVRHSADDNGPSIRIGKTRGTGSELVSDDDFVGLIRFFAGDGTDRGSTVADIFCQIDGSTGANDTPGNLQFHTTADGSNSSTERMRVHSGGNVSIATTSTGGGSVLTLSTGSFTHGIKQFCNNGQKSLTVEVGGSEVGSISHSTSATAFNTSSDYRLKENVVTDWDATTRLKQLKPSRFNFILDADTTVDGFLAHEVSDVVPEAITGTKDAVDEDGNPEYQGIDQSKLVPLLTKALQESIARADALEARIKKLEDG